MRKQLLLSLLAALSMNQSTSANPSGFECISGEAALSLVESSLLEITTGKQSVIQWKDFSIDKHETTRFIMPDEHSTVVNRVLGGNVSEILGKLEANGQVYLINPKGVLVGEGATVNTASFIASSFDLFDHEPRSVQAGAIVNLGSIRAAEVLLMGGEVTNTGIIDALGSVSQEGRVYLVAQGGTVQNSGIIKAENANRYGGRVILLGENVGVVDKGLIDVSGDFSGGSVFIGKS